MATFNVCVRSKRADGFYNIYIRLIHNREIQYIKTGYAVAHKNTKKVYDKKGKESLEITDKFVLKQCLVLIENYQSKMNYLPVKTLSSKELVNILVVRDVNISFTAFANKFIDEMINSGREKSSKNYKTAVTSLSNSLGKSEDDLIYFKEITSQAITKWIKELSFTRRAKQMYPNAIKTIFESALDEYNDYDNNIIKIQNEPFRRVKIPNKDTPEKRSVDGIILYKYLTALPQSPREIIAQDVSKIIICLAGINVADIYNLPLTALAEDWKLKYNRSKTKIKRSDNAYFEITVPENIRPVIDKYRGNKRLFIFSENYYLVDGLLKAVNEGLKSISKRLNLPQITTYSLRHSWATIAQNKCTASIEDVAFALNHSSAHKITEGYIEKDYSRVDELNEKVIKYVFLD